MISGLLVLLAHCQGHNTELVQMHQGRCPITAPFSPLVVSMESSCTLSLIFRILFFYSKALLADTLMPF